MAQAHVLISSQTLGATTGTVTFSSIPNTYRDLMIVINGTATAATQPSVNFNADATSANYVMADMFAPTGGGTQLSQTSTTTYSISAVDTNPFVHTLQILDYSATDKHKSMVSRTNSAGRGVTEAAITRWANTSAISTVALTAASWASGTTFYLYGVLG